MDKNIFRSLAGPIFLLISRPYLLGAFFYEINIFSILKNLVKGISDFKLSKVGLIYIKDKNLFNYNFRLKVGDIYE